jgi:hypothetical protein
MVQFPEIFKKRKESKKPKENIVNVEQNIVSIKTKKPIKFGPLIATAFYLLFPGFSGTVRAETFHEATEVIGKVVTGIVLLDSLAEILKVNRLDKQNVEKAYNQTRELNDIVVIKEFLKPGKRFAFGDVKIKYRYYYPYYGLDIKEASKQLVGTLFSQLGLQEVGHLKDIRAIARERKELRSIQEVEQGLIPPPGTLKPPDYKVDISVSLVTKRGFQNRDLGITSRREDIVIFDTLRSAEMVAVIVIDILDQETNRKISMIGIGVPSPVEEMSSEIRRVSSRVRYMNVQIKQNDLMVLESLSSSVDNLLKAISATSGKKENISYPIMVDPSGDNTKLVIKKDRY